MHNPGHPEEQMINPSILGYKIEDCRIRPMCVVKKDRIYLALCRDYLPPSGIPTILYDVKPGSSTPFKTIWPDQKTPPPLRQPQLPFQLKR